MALPDFVQKMIGGKVEPRPQVFDLSSLLPENQRTKSQVVKPKGETILEVLRFEEGFRPRPYLDTEGNLTVGSGFNIDDPTVSRLVPRDVALGKRNLTEDENTAILEALIPRAEKDARIAIGEDTFNNLEPARQRALVNMAFQLGRGRLMTFENMITAIKTGEVDAAVREMLDSKANKQTPNRFRRNAERFLKGGE